jgi:hypothetical protein
MAEAERDFVQDVTDEKWVRLQQTVLETKKEDDAETGGENR